VAYSLYGMGVATKRGVQRGRIQRRNTGQPVGTTQCQGNTNFTAAGKGSHASLRPQRGNARVPSDLSARRSIEEKRNKPKKKERTWCENRIKRCTRQATRRHNSIRTPHWAQNKKAQPPNSFQRTIAKTSVQLTRGGAALALTAKANYTA